jgi:hypothetical protein
MSLTKHRCCIQPAKKASSESSLIWSFNVSASGIILGYLMPDIIRRKEQSDA